LHTHPAYLPQKSECSPELRFLLVQKENLFFGIF
jgi:hypothetical protein